jgi:hypothetical protein
VSASGRTARVRDIRARRHVAPGSFQSRLLVVRDRERVSSLSKILRPRSDDHLVETIGLWTLPGLGTHDDGSAVSSSSSRLPRCS